MLEITDLETGYGKKQVLFGVNLNVPRGTIVALIGPNGAGKSTILKAICGLIPVWNGEIKYDGIKINGSIPAQNVKRGITYAPQGKRVFDELTVFENLEIGGYQISGKELKSRIKKVSLFFPQLAERFSQEAGKLSGGEQQMLSFARALITEPQLLLLDEPSLGLSPILVKRTFTKISAMNQEFGLTILVVEQKVREVLEICHRVYSIKLGKISFSGIPNELKQNKERLKNLFL